MAKRPSDQDQRQHSQLRVFFVELNGSDATIEEALRTVERMRRAAEIPNPIKRMVAGTSAEAQALASSTPAPEADPDPQEDTVATEDGEVPSSSETGARQRRGQGPKKDRNAGIQLVGELDFVPKDKLALRAFFAEKAPSSDMDQVLVLCYYLQHILSVSGYGPGHVMTGFKHVEKPVPVDLRQTIRNLKGNKAWLNFDDMESIRVTTQGDNRVEHELGVKAGESGAD